MMKQLEIINKAMHLFVGSFINANNELIMIPKFNVYTRLDDVENERDFKIKLVRWFSRECCCATRYNTKNRLIEYYSGNTRVFNDICQTSFSVEDMQIIYQKLGNGCNYTLCEQFADSGFDIEILRRCDYGIS